MKRILTVLLLLIIPFIAFISCSTAPDQERSQPGKEKDGATAYSPVAESTSLEQYRNTEWELSLLCAASTR